MILLILYTSTFLHRSYEWNSDQVSLRFNG